MPGESGVLVELKLLFVVKAVFWLDTVPRAHGSNCTTEKSVLELEPFVGTDSSKVICAVSKVKKAKSARRGRTRKDWIATIVMTLFFLPRAMVRIWCAVTTLGAMLAVLWSRLEVRDQERVENL